MKPLSSKQKEALLYVKDICNKATEALNEGFKTSKDLFNYIFEKAYLLHEIYPELDDERELTNNIIMSVFNVLNNNFDMKEALIKIKDDTKNIIDQYSEQSPLPQLPPLSSHYNYYY